MMKLVSMFMRAALPLVLSASTSAYAAPALWAATDGHATVYLFGTSHAVRPAAQWRTPKLEAAIRASKRLWLEIGNMDDKVAGAALVQQLGLDPGTPLATRLTAAQNEKLAAVLTQYGLTPAQVAPMRPWLAATTLAVLPLRKAGLDTKAGADLAIRTAAQADGDAIDGFETAEQQIRYLAELPIADQIVFLDDVVRRAADGTALTLRIADAWEAGDLATLDRIINAELRERSPALFRRLIVERNRRFADRIKALLAGTEDQLVAVGAAHLVGSDSIRATLERSGVKVRQLQ